MRGWRKIGRVNAYLLPRKPVSERVNNDDIPKSRTVQFLNLPFSESAIFEALPQPSSRLKARIVEAKITMRWLRISRVSLCIVSASAKSLFSLTYDQGMEKRCCLFWLINSASYMSGSSERKRQNASYHWLCTAVPN